MSRKKLHQFYVIKGPDKTRSLNRITHAIDIQFQHIFRSCIVITLINYSSHYVKNYIQLIIHDI